MKNSKHFPKFYFGNKYLTSIICLVSGCDVSMLMRMISQTGGTPKPGISKFWYTSGVECTSSTLILPLHMEKVFVSSECSHLTHSGHSKQHQCCHRSRWKKCLTNGKKLCGKDILFSVGLMGHSVLIWNLRICSANSTHQF